MAKKINEASSTDLPIIFKIRDEYGWKVGDTLLYQQIYDLSENLKKIKDVFASNLASKRSIDEKEIFGNPIYERHIGSHDDINKKFGCKLSSVTNNLKTTFGNRLNA